MYKCFDYICKKRREGYDAECDQFCTESNDLYDRCLLYIDKCKKTMEDFSCFQWMTLTEMPSWSDVEPCLFYLIEKEVDVDDAKCFDQFVNHKQFVENYKDDEEFSDSLIHKKWTKYFENSKNIELHL